jgi:hypothetical protein
MSRLLSNTVGSLPESLIRVGIRASGRNVARADHPWLDCPIGPPGRIGEAFFDRLAAQEGLEVRRGSPDAGLIATFAALRGPAFDPDKIRPEVRHFYEHTALYELEAWNETSPFSRPFLWLLVKLVSHRMEQLNFPVSPLETSRGMTSEVIQLVERGSGRVAYTGWLRKLTGTGRVVYAGFYSAGRPEACAGTCVKVSFPVPHGSAVVFLRPEALPDGSLRLVSKGTGFGGPGFYRVVATGPGRWRVRYLRTLHEVFHVWVDEHGTLRTDHSVRFMGVGVLRLHYKLSLRPGTPGP